MNTEPTAFPESGIATERLLLSAAKPAHAQRLRTYLRENSDYLQPWEPLRDDAYFELAAVSDRLRAMARNNAQGDGMHFLIFDRETGKVAGVCNFSNIVRGPFQACHLGYSLAQSLQGQGLMHEALSIAIRHVFDNMLLHRIMANYRPENTRSARLLERLGFQREGEAASYLKINGVWTDHVLTALINPRDGAFMA